MNKILNIFTIVALSFIVGVGCRGRSENDPNTGPNPAANPKRVIWERVSKENNPRIDTSDFNIEGAEKLKINLFGFDGDVGISYSPSQKPKTLTLNVYTVFRESASFGALYTSTSEKTLSIDTQGVYSCSIKTQNGEITALKGGCYVRIEVVLPAGSQVEVYNVSKLLSQRFIAMSNEELITNVHSGPFAKDKSEAIDLYLSSFKETGKTASLLAKQLGQVIHEFSWKDEKLQTLTKLFALVSDKNNLESMIADEFSYFDQNDARAIVGLPKK